jgi:hypothetical protein
MKITNYVMQESDIISSDLGLKLLMNKYGMEIRCCTAARTLREDVATFNEWLYRASYLDEAFPKIMD